MKKMPEYSEDDMFWRNLLIIIKLDFIAMVIILLLMSGPL